MKTLILVRHAQAEPAAGARNDRQRALDARGRDDAARAGARLAARGVRPARLIASPALRALTTAHLFADALGIARDHIVVDEQLYASSVEALLAVVQGLDEHVGTAMLFGHNPEFSDFARRLSPTIVSLHTCAVAEFDLDGAWRELGLHPPRRAALDA